MSARPMTIARIFMVAIAEIGCGAAPSWAQTFSTQLSVSLDRSYGPGWLQSIVALPGGGYAVAGHRSHQAEEKASVIRLDEKGDILWERAVEGKTIVPTGRLSLMPSGQLVLKGLADNGDDWAWTLDLHGKTLSEKSFGGPQVTFFRRTVALPDGGWASVGDDLDTLPKPNPTLFRFDSNGALLSRLALPSPALDESHTFITPVGSSGLVVVWTSASEGGAKGRPRVIRFDTATWEPAGTSQSISIPNWGRKWRSWLPFPVEVSQSPGRSTATIAAPRRG
jgi:hypothetical protein